MKSLVFLMLFGSSFCYSQEIKCTVSLNASQLDVNTSGDKQIFVQMEQAIKDFMNNQRWTNDIFNDKEKIKCNLSINLLKSRGQYSYSGNAQLQVIRPVFGQTYESVIFQYLDRSFDASFAPEDRTMIFNEQSFNSNLSSMLAYYSLIALAVDYDSFSKLGGNPYVDRAYNVARLAATFAQGPWSTETDPRNRYWLVENLRNQQMTPYRESFYTYHRLALDQFGSDTELHRKQVFDVLSTIKTVAILKPNAIIFRTFFDAKANELIGIFSNGSKEEKQSAFKLLSQVDPSKTESYRQILK